MAYRCPTCAPPAGVALAFVMAGLACRGEAQEPPHWEVWSGGQAIHDTWSIYSGTSWAPFAGIQQDGVRLRGVVGYGDHRGGEVAFGDLLVGYQKHMGPFTLELLGGVGVAEQRSADGSRSRLAGKGVMEVWWTVTEQAWASADLMFALAPIDHVDGVDYGSRLRLGWRLWPELSVGLEGGSGGLLLRALVPATSRAGGFLRYEWATGEASLSGGVAIDERPAPDRHGPGAFGTVSVMTRF